MKEFLKTCKDTYYAGRPIITDEQYDALVDIYGEDYVGSKSGDIPHYNRLYSLQKKYMGEDKFSTGEYIRTHKADGASIALLYVSGAFVQALTRGDGIRGKDITPLIQEWDAIPKRIEHFNNTVQITGEVVASKDRKNSRNYAAGALNLKSVDEFLSRELWFLAHGLYPSHNVRYKFDLDWLTYQGFGRVLEVDHIATLHYPTDGEVWRLNDNEEYEKQGYTSHHPRGAFALKERSDGVKTTLLDVEWQTGKSGKVTPVAILKPVEIDGATISRATLNNVGFIEALGVEIGDEVMVERAGGIIPRIIKKAA
jgi:DNA ligase (NAD+)